MHSSFRTHVRLRKSLRVSHSAVSDPEREDAQFGPGGWRFFGKPARLVHPLGRRPVPLLLSCAAPGQVLLRPSRAEVLRFYPSRTELCSFLRGKGERLTPWDVRGSTA